MFSRHIEHRRTIMKYLLSIFNRTALNRIQYCRSLSSSVNKYNQLATTCDPQSDIYKVFEPITEHRWKMSILILK